MYILNFTHLVSISQQAYLDLLSKTDIEANLNNAK